MMIHPEVFVYVCIQDVPDPDKPEDWVYFVFLCWLGEKDPSLSPEEVMKIAKERGSKIQEPFRSAIQWIPEDVKFPYVDVSYWVAKPWDSHKGRVTLAGDAAHPMPPYVVTQTSALQTPNNRSLGTAAKGSTTLYKMRITLSKS